MASNEAEESSKVPRRTSSKYDFVKVKVWIGENSDHYYVLSRFLVSRMLTVTKISNVVAIKIALELKKLLVDNNLLDVSQADLEANLFKLMHRRGYGEEYVNRYKMMTNFHHQRVPLLVLVAGTACVGKSTIATQLAQRLNLPNVLQTDIIYELLRTDPNNAAPLNGTPLWARTDLTSTEDLMQEFRRECRVIRKGVDGDLTKTLSDGKPLIMEGLHLDPGIYLSELPQMRVRNPSRLKQVKVHPSESLTVPQTAEKREVSKPDPVQKGPKLGGNACSEPGSRVDESGSSRGLRSDRTGLSRGVGDSQESTGAQSAESEKRELLTSASGSGRVETRAGETRDESGTGTRSVNGRRDQKRSRGRMQNLADAKEFLKSLAAKDLGETETRAGPRSGVKKSASSSHVAGELGVSPRGLDPGTPKWSEPGRPQDSPRGLSELRASSAGRSTGSDGKGHATEASDRIGVTSQSQPGEDTPTARKSGELDTDAGVVGQGQPETPAGVSSVELPADGAQTSGRGERDIGGLAGRHAGREPLSSVAQRVAADSCTSSVYGPSRGDRELGRGRPDSGSVAEARPYERSAAVAGNGSSERSNSGGQSSKRNGFLSESHQQAAEPIPIEATSVGTEPDAGMVPSERSEAVPGNSPSERSNIGGQSEPAGRSKAGGKTNPCERCEMVAGNGPFERFESGGESEPAGRSKGGPPDVIAEIAPSGRFDNGDPKSGPDEAIVVQIVLRMSEEDHSALLDEWLASRRGAVDGDVMLAKAAVLQRLRTIQDYLCSFEDQGVAVVDVSTTSFAQTLDQLHSHLLECIESGWSGADR